MNIQLCTKPGLARRAGGFEEIKTQALATGLSPITRIDMDRAIAQGTPQLSPGARCLLMFYASHLSMDEATKEQTAVFPGTARATACLGISPATLRRHKAELEQAGFLIRCYDRRNRPLEGGAIDLRPLLVKVPAILATLATDLEGQRSDWRSKRCAEETSDMSAQVLTLEPLNSTKKSPENSSAKEIEKRRGKGDPPSAPEVSTNSEDKDLITQVLASSPKLRAALPEDFRGSSPHPTRALRLVLPALFPSESEASIGHTGLWAEQRLGAAMFAAVAIALEDPAVRRPAAYFGRLVTKAEAYDPQENLKRLATLNPPPVVFESHGEPLADRVTEHLSREIGIASLSSWFSPGRACFSLRDQTLVIEVATCFAKKRIEEAFSAPLNRVAQSVGAVGVELRLKEEPSAPDRQLRIQRLE